MKELLSKAISALTILGGLSFSNVEAFFDCDWNCNANIVGDAGYRVDNLKWSIQGAGGTPNILSELTFRDIKIFEVGLKGTAVVCNGIYVRGNFDYGWILNGKTQDSDYLGNNRTDEYSRSIINTNDDHVFDASIGIGYIIDVCQTGLTIASLGGYSYQEQKFRMSNGEQVIDTIGDIGLGPISGLNSTYQARWNSPWVGVDIGYANPEWCNVFFFATYEYHWVNFQGKGHWNLRDDILDGTFIHRSHHGHGDVLKVGADYIFCNNWLLGVSGDFQWWRSGYGIDSLNAVDEGVIVPSFTTLNPVKWRSYAVKLDIGYVF